MRADAGRTGAACPGPARSSCPATLLSYQTRQPSHARPTGPGRAGQGIRAHLAVMRAARQPSWLVQPQHKNVVMGPITTYAVTVTAPGTAGIPMIMVKRSWRVGQLIGVW